MTNKTHNSKRKRAGTAIRKRASILLLRVRVNRCHSQQPSRQQPSQKSPRAYVVSSEVVNQPQRQQKANHPQCHECTRPRSKTHRTSAEQNKSKNCYRRRHHCRCRQVSNSKHRRHRRRHRRRRCRCRCRRRHHHRCRRRRRRRLPFVVRRRRRSSSSVVVASLRRCVVVAVVVGGVVVVVVVVVVTVNVAAEPQTGIYKCTSAVSPSHTHLTHGSANKPPRTLTHTLPMHAHRCVSAFIHYKQPVFSINSTITKRCVLYRYSWEPAASVVVRVQRLDAVYCKIPHSGARAGTGVLRCHVVAARSAIGAICPISGGGDRVAGGLQRLEYRE